VPVQILVSLLDSGHAIQEFAPLIRKRNQHFAPRVQASRRAQCPTQCCSPSISRRDITQGELPDTGLEPAQKECFSIRARSLPPKQKTEEGSHTSRFRKAWRLLLQTAWQALVAPQRPLTATAHGNYWFLTISNPHRVRSLAWGNSATREAEAGRTFMGGTPQGESANATNFV